MRPTVVKSPFDFLLLAWLLVPVVDGCGPASAAPDRCAADPKIVCPADFDGWSCGAGRPDQISNVNNVVESRLCAYTETQSNGTAGFCCTRNTTSCASDPSIVCPNGSGVGELASNAVVGYSCMGTNRPDALDPMLTCQQGINAYGHIVFCCSSKGTAGSCVRNDGVSCQKGTLGFSCSATGVPSEMDLGINQSRSGVPLVCSLAMRGASSNDYCCYAPTATPPGATCLQDQLAGQLQLVPGCQAGSFGFACTGIDTPDQDYQRMACSHGGVRGVNATGIPATLYCCEFHQ
jgi:hypothetical protein